MGIECCSSDLEPEVGTRGVALVLRWGQIQAGNPDLDAQYTSIPGHVRASWVCTNHARTVEFSPSRFTIAACFSDLSSKASHLPVATCPTRRRKLACGDKRQTERSGDVKSQLQYLRFPELL